jgi:hypothetical protein
VTAPVPRYVGTVEPDSLFMVRTEWNGPDLGVSVQQGPVAITVHLPRDDVRLLVPSLEDWLYDSRPSA